MVSEPLTVRSLYFHCTVISAGHYLACLTGHNKTCWLLSFRKITTAVKACHVENVVCWRKGEREMMQNIQVRQP